MMNISQEHHQPVQEKKMQDFLAVNLSLWAMLKTAAVPNRCFDNAWRTFLALPEAFSDGKFVEGWLVLDLEDKVILNEHGWCELRDGTIVDPSILLLVDFDQPVYYFPGVTRDWNEMQTLIDEERELPYVRFDGVHGKDGLGHPTYKLAHDAAKEKVIQLAHTKTPPKEMRFLSAQDIGDDPRNADSIVHIVIMLPEQRREEQTDE